MDGARLSTYLRWNFRASDVKRLTQWMQSDVSANGAQFHVAIVSGLYGAGKTELVRRAVALASSVPRQRMSCRVIDLHVGTTSETLDDLVGATRRALGASLGRASLCANTVLVLDDLDLLANGRDLRAVDELLYGLAHATVVPDSLKYLRLVVVVPLATPGGDCRMDECPDGTDGAWATTDVYNYVRQFNHERARPYRPCSTRHPCVADEADPDLYTFVCAAHRTAHCQHFVLHPLTCEVLEEYTEKIVFKHLASQGWTATQQVCWYLAHYDCIIRMCETRNLRFVFNQLALELRGAVRGPVVPNAAEQVKARRAALAPRLCPRLATKAQLQRTLLELDGRVAGHRERAEVYLGRFSREFMAKWEDDMFIFPHDGDQFHDEWLLRQEAFAELRSEGDQPRVPGVTPEEELRRYHVAPLLLVHKPPAVQVNDYVYALGRPVPRAWPSLLSGCEEDGRPAKRLCRALLERAQALPESQRLDRSYAEIHNALHPPPSRSAEPN